MGQCRRRLACKAAGPRKEVNNGNNAAIAKGGTQIPGEQIISIILYDFMS